MAPSAKPEVHYNYKTALLSAEDQAAAMGATKISWSSDVRFLRLESGQTYRQAWKHVR